jgi:hypothetical protein
MTKKSLLLGAILALAVPGVALADGWHGHGGGWHGHDEHWHGGWGPRAYVYAPPPVYVAPPVVYAPPPPPVYVAPPMVYAPPVVVAPPSLFLGFTFR